MLVRRHLSILVFGLCAALLALNSVQAGKPIPCGKDAPTEAKWQEQVYQWRLKEVDSYKKITQDPPEIRDKTVSFLQGYLQQVFLRPGAPSWKTLEEQADQLAAQGAKDPFFQMCRGDVKIHRGNAKDGIPIAGSACRDLASTEYSPFLKFQAAHNWYLASKSRPRFAKDFEDSSNELVSSFVALLEATADQPEEQKYTWSEVLELVGLSAGTDEKTRAIHDAIYKALRRTEKLHPWTKLMLSGNEHQDLAWRARGTGFIHTVSPDNLRTFNEQMEKAAECFTKAWELDPTVPHAASKMIGIASSAGIGPLSPRDWFDRAVETRMDYPLAYRQMVSALLPKWGGSIEELEQFATECANTKRFDTEVPYHYVMTLYHLDKDLGREGKAWFIKGTYPKAKAVLQAMEKEPNRSAESIKTHSREWILSLQGTIAAKVGEYDDARKAFDKVGKGLRKDAFSYVKSDYPMDYSRVYALTGGGRDETAEAEELLGDEPPEDLETLRKTESLLETAAKKTTEPEAQRYLKFRTTYIKWLRRFQEGEWVDLTFDKDLLMWEQPRGAWRYEDENTVLGERSERRGLRLVCKVPFKGALEVDLDIEALDSKPLYMCGLLVGGFRDPSKANTGYSFWFVPKVQLAGIDIHRTRRRPMNRGLFFTRAISAYGPGTSRAFFIPTTASSPRSPTEGTSLNDRFELFVSGLQTDDAGQARYSNIRVRKLAAPAPPTGKNTDRVPYFNKLIAEHPDDAFLYLPVVGSVTRSSPAIGGRRKPTSERPRNSTLVFPWPHLAWSRVTFEMGDIEATIAQIGECLKQCPNDRNALHGSAWLLSTWGDEKIRKRKPGRGARHQALRADPFRELHRVRDLGLCPCPKTATSPRPSSGPKKALELCQNPKGQGSHHGQTQAV